VSSYEFWKDFAGPIATMIQNVILVLAAAIAWSTIKNNHAIAAKRATLDLIDQLSRDQVYKDSLRIVNSMRKVAKDTGSLWNDLASARAGSDDHKEAFARHQAAGYVLSRYSIFANGIRSGALDDELFKQYYYSTFIEVTQQLKGFMQSTRVVASNSIKARKYVTHETVYSEIEWLLEEWEAKPLEPPPKPKRDRWRPKLF
jgi:hypothetical protein